MLMSKKVAALNAHILLPKVVKSVLQDGASMTCRKSQSCQLRLFG